MIQICKALFAFPEAVIGKKNECFCVFSCRAREALRQCLPDQLKDSTFAQVLKDDATTKRWLAQLVKNLQEGQVTDARGIPLAPQ